MQNNSVTPSKVQSELPVMQHAPRGGGIVLVGTTVVAMMVVAVIGGITLVVAVAVAAVAVVGATVTVEIGGQGSGQTTSGQTGGNSSATSPKFKQDAVNAGPEGSRVYWKAVVNPWPHPLVENICTRKKLKLVAVEIPGTNTTEVPLLPTKEANVTFFSSEKKSTSRIVRDIVQYVSVVIIPCAVQNTLREESLASTQMSVACEGANAHATSGQIRSGGNSAAFSPRYMQEPSNGPPLCVYLNWVRDPAPQRLLGTITISQKNAKVELKFPDPVAAETKSTGCSKGTKLTFSNPSRSSPVPVLIHIVLTVQ